MQQRTFQDVIAALKEDETWDVPKDKRDYEMFGLAWTLLML